MVGGTVQTHVQLRVSRMFLRDVHGRERVIRIGVRAMTADSSEPSIFDPHDHLCHEDRYTMEAG